MNGRNTQYSRRRRGNLKAKVGIAAAVLVGGGAIGVAAVAATHHTAASTASSAGYTTSVVSPAALANGALNANTAPGTFSALAKLGVKNFAQFKVAGHIVAVQRGAVVLVTPKFAIVKSQNGALELWWLSSGTKFANVAGNIGGTTALTGSLAAAKAEKAGVLAPAVNAVSSKSLIAGLLTPVATPKVLIVTDAATGTTVKVVIVKNTATVWTKTVTKTSTTTTKIVESAFTSVKGLKRGELTLVLGLHAGGALHAAKILFEPAVK
jgi:hypothetical protein